MILCSIDDIEDNSKLRRGIPVAHSIYGVAQSINSANYVYFLALEKIMAMGHPRGVTIFTSKGTVAYVLEEAERERGREKERDEREREGRRRERYMSHMITVLSSEQLLELHRGQGKDIYWRDSFICPTEEEYMEMVRQSKLLATPTYSAMIYYDATLYTCCHRNWWSICTGCGSDAAV